MQIREAIIKRIARTITNYLDPVREPGKQHKGEYDEFDLSQAEAVYTEVVEPLIAEFFQEFTVAWDDPKTGERRQMISFPTLKDAQEALALNPPDLRRDMPNYRIESRWIATWELESEDDQDR